MKYAASTKGFYDPEINGENIPQDAVDVLDSDYALLMAGQSEGKEIVPNQSGYPVLQDPPEPSVDRKKEICKQIAQAKLSITDWSQYPDVAQTLLNQEEFTIYRAVVRGLLINPVPNPTWPDEPKAEWKV